MQHDEYKIHVAILEHIRTAFPQVRAFHVPNQSKDATEAFWNKQLGAEPGVSDLIIGWKGNTGVLEVKSHEGKLSPAQNKFLSWADSVGWHTGIARNVRKAHHILMAWGLEPKHNSIREPDLRTSDEKKRDAYNLYAPPDRRKP